MLRTFCLALALLFSAMAQPAPALADDWEACMAQPAPKFFYVADKSRKLLFQMEERGGVPAAVREFECIHGRVEGDKQKQGDLKTPEGVYFLTKVITQKLDFMEYGPYAVALNYPNPADRLRRKTGSGIWLHSKGRKITGITTRGCLAIDKGEIMEIAPLLKPGTPIIVAEKAVGAPFFDNGGKALPVGAKVSTPSPSPSPATSPALPAGTTEVFGKLTDSAKPEAAQPSACVHAVEFPVSPAPAFCTVQTADAPRIRELTQRWLDQRKACDKGITALYHQKAWPVSSREKFDSKKARLFAGFNSQKDLAIDSTTLSVMHGPGYWVSCFEERYTLGKEKRHNLRALYWMKNEAGEYRIIGETLIRK